MSKTTGQAQPKVAADVIKVSVRTLVEFIMRSGDLESGSGRMDADAMQAGSRLHRKIQKSMGSNYTAEMPLSIEIPLEDGDERFLLVVEGRADGVIREQDDSFVIDEIKCMYRDVMAIEKPEQVHLAQARCYAYMLGVKEERITLDNSFYIQLTYCNIETENIKYFKEELSGEELTAWFDALIKEYAKWAAWERRWKKLRNASAKELQFPFDYREGQRDFTAGVYRSVLREKKLFAMAPTGVGKTISTVFPTVKAVGEGLTEKLFYLTAKTIVRTVAEETFSLLVERGLMFKTVTVTAKEKICVLEKPECNPFACPRAKGHFDRVNDALFDMLSNEKNITRELIEAYAEKHMVCPFEFCLDLTLWADAVICDYNYVFDPTASLKRFFAGDGKNNYVFLIDEAHNLPERAREMYSATLWKEEFLHVKRLFGKHMPKLTRRLEACNKELLRLKRECDSFTEHTEFGTLAIHLTRFLTDCEEYLKDEKRPGTERDAVLNLYFEARHFLAMYDFSDTDYRFYTSYGEDGSFYARVQCMQPARALGEQLKKGRSAVFFSATLLPVRYYMEELGGTEEDYAIYVPSPFRKEQRLVMVGCDVNFRYANRGRRMYEKAADYILKFAEAKKGNYFVFFSSYRMLQDVAAVLEERLTEQGTILHRQKTNMTETEREEFLAEFTAESEETHIGLCVLGGIFGEGIDLKGERLIGAVIVGTGLPLVCDERELFRRYYDEQAEAGRDGFSCAYLYPGMNKVQQAAGRVIRTMEDKGAVLLLDDRFAGNQYASLFPKEWYPYETVTLSTMGGQLEKFWKTTDE
ncbi:MAG: ATP-dependent DNA helicase [Lachnospiraceae bacterium]|nr:ATP-dependent DNA helicase [Lachnospiraceae bacterium]